MPERTGDLELLREHFTEKFREGVGNGEKEQRSCERRRRWTADVAKFIAPGIAAVSAIAGVATLADVFGSNGKTVAAWFAIAAAAMTAVAGWVTTLATDIATTTQRWMMFTEACRDYGDVHVNSDRWLEGNGGQLAWDDYLFPMFTFLTTGAKPPDGKDPFEKPRELIALDHETSIRTGTITRINEG